MSLKTAIKNIVIGAVAFISSLMVGGFILFLFSANKLLLLPLLIAYIILIMKVKDWVRAILIFGAISAIPIWLYLLMLLVGSGVAEGL